MADLSRFVNATEYLRRNSAHANAVGAHANTKAALARLLKMKRPPMWLVAALEGIERRTAIAHPEVAAWRNSAPDNPYVENAAAIPVNEGKAGDDGGKGEAIQHPSTRPRSVDGATEALAGWKLVPVELTQPMREAWDTAPNGENDDENMRAGYRAMLAAAPSPDGVPAVGGGEHG